MLAYENNKTKSHYELLNTTNHQTQEPIHSYITPRRKKHQSYRKKLLVFFCKIGALESTCGGIYVRLLYFVVRVRYCR